MTKKPPYGLYLLLALLALSALTFSLRGSAGPVRFLRDLPSLWARLIQPLMSITLFIAAGLFVGQLIEGLGWTRRLTVTARPFMRWGHLTDQMGAAFTAAFFSGTASLSMLVSFHQEGSMSRREMTLSVLLNTFPSYFLHLPTTFFIILPLLGGAGIVYLLLTFGAALLRLGLVLVYAHLRLPESGGKYQAPESSSRPWRTLIRETAAKFRSRFVRIFLVVLPVYVIMLLISDMGFFLWLRKTLALKVTHAFIPLEAMSIVIFSLVAEFTSGYAAAGALLEAGDLNLFQAVLALLLGNILATPVRALRHQMPYYLGIFSPRQGLFLMLATQAFRIVSLLAAGLTFVLLAALLS